jgi:hypothetical protein
VAVADGTYSSLKLLDRCRGLRKPITFITRSRLDGALYESAPLRRPDQIGRPRLKGGRLANLSVVAEDPTTDWTPIMAGEWYGREKRTVEVVSATAVWHSTGLPAVPLRWAIAAGRTTGATRPASTTRAFAPTRYTRLFGTWSSGSSLTLNTCGIALMRMIEKETRGYARRPCAGGEHLAGEAG